MRATVIYSRASDTSVSFGRAVFLPRPYKRADIYTVNAYPGAIINFSRYNYSATTPARRTRTRHRNESPRYSWISSKRAYPTVRQKLSLIKNIVREVPWIKFSTSNYEAISSLLPRIFRSSQLSSIEQMQQ